MNEKFGTISAEKEVIKKFQRYCRERGFSTGRALKLAIDSWIEEGCDKDIKSFKEI